MSSSNQHPANRGFRSVLRCAISHYRQFPWLSAPEPAPENARTQLSRTSVTPHRTAPSSPIVTGDTGLNGMAR